MIIQSHTMRLSSKPSFLVCIVFGFESINQSDTPSTRLIYSLPWYNAVALPEINIPIPKAIKNSIPNN